MDPDLSAEDLVIKTRKPYTITRQRERWTEEEHTKFLEALKLYGRAWQRIEEHIGTKTAVQIRSHAQKFFTKLEKQTTVKGVGNAHDIEIPPPRPKRKPSNPYPRKPCIAPVFQLGLKDGKASDATSTLLQQNIAAFENDPEKSKECHERESCFDGPYASLTSADDSSSVSEPPLNPCTFRQYIPVIDDSSNQDEIEAASQVTAKPVGNHSEVLKSSLTMNTCPSEDPCREMVTEPEQSGICCQTSITDEQSSQNYPRHVPVHILAGNLGTSAHHFPIDMSFMQWMSAGTHGDQNHFIPVQNSDDYQKFWQMRSTFSSFILSSSSQNASVCAAASFASNLWPWFSIGAPAEPSANLTGFSQLQSMSSTSNMEAIAAATVAAATAWWTANGLLPLCHHPGFMCSPASATAAQTIGFQSGNMDGEARENIHDPAFEIQQPDAEFLVAQNLNEKLPAPPSSDSEASEADKLNVVSNTTESADVLHESNKSENKKQIDRSSCGSNTTSGSDVEPENIEKLAKGKEEKHIAASEVNKVLQAPTPIADLFSRRSRNNNTVAESWKEVSEEGRIAFQALFSREVLPQSFALSNKEANKQCSKHEGNGLMLKHDVKREVEKSSFVIGNKQEGLSSEGPGQNKLKTYRTGFKPYKRCSMEAKETRISSNHQEEEKDPKKLRLETEVNTTIS